MSAWYLFGVNGPIQQLQEGLCADLGEDVPGLFRR
jgi:hypothetical protein